MNTSNARRRPMAKAPYTIRKRGKSWQVVLRVNGERHQFGPRYDPFLGSDPIQNAVVEWALRKRTELVDAAERKRELGDSSESLRFSEFLEQFRAEEMPTLARGTASAYEDTFGPAEEFFVQRMEDPTLEKIQAKDIKAYLSWRRVNRRDGKSPLSNRTLAKDRAVLHRLFALADQLEYREGNPVARVPAPKCDDHDPVILNDAEYERLLAECREAGPMLGLYALVLGETGCRAYSEALRLTWEDVDLEGGFLWIASGRDGHRTKSGKGRWVPMTSRIRKAMREHFQDFRLVTYRGATLILDLPPRT